jgi:hypothetical protein
LAIAFVKAFCFLISVKLAIFLTKTCFKKEKMYYKLEQGKAYFMGMPSSGLFDK